MKSLTVPLFMLLTLISAGVPGQTQVITDGGREVVIHEDGSWEFSSPDRFATLPDGTRVRLQDDGSWEVVESGLPVLQAPIRASQEVNRTGIQSITMSMARVTIESRSERVQKNVRTTSQTLLELDLVSPAIANGPVTIDLSAPGALRVEDSKGKDYEILEITPQTLSVGPGATAIFSVRVDGSPSFRNSKQMLVVLDRALTGTTRDLVAEYDMSEARERPLAD